MDKKVLMGLIFASICGILLFVVVINKTKKKNMVVVLKEYNGIYKDHPNIKLFQKNFDSIVRRAKSNIKNGHPNCPVCKKIQKTLGNFKEPPITVTVELDDSFKSDTFIEPSAAVKCPLIPYSKERGNCRSYGIRIGAKPLADNYKGRTTIEQAMTHELTHIFMMFNIPNHEKLPSYLIEGVPIHMSGQGEQIKNIQRTGKIGHHVYKENEIPVHKYSNIVNEFEKKFASNL